LIKVQDELYCFEAFLGVYRANKALRQM
jgi:hypothetical protein